MDDKVKISFDKEYKIRVLDAQKFAKAEDLQKESSAFVEKISTFNEKVTNLVDVLEKHATRIDSQKLRVNISLSFILCKLFSFSFLLFHLFQAIGLRLAVENEAEQRNKQRKTLQAIISEKKSELDR